MLYSSFPVPLSRAPALFLDPASLPFVGVRLLNALSGLDPKNWGGAHGNQTPAWGILQTAPDEISVYWAEHYDNYPAKEITPQLRRGTLRLDGFVSVNAPYAGGEFITKPLLFEGRKLTLNISTSAVGSVKVEIQDAGGKPLAGFAAEIASRSGATRSPERSRGRAARTSRSSRAGPCGCDS